MTLRFMRAIGALLALFLLIVGSALQANVDAAARGLAVDARIKASIARPTNNLFCAFGDSLTFVNWGSDPSTGTGAISPPTQGTMQPRSYAFWAQALSNGRVRFPQEYNFGVSGETTADVLLRLPSVLASPCAAVAVLAGTNDRGAAGLTSAQTIANLTTIVTRLRSAGKIVFLMTVPPRGNSTTSYFTSPQLQYWVAVNAWIKSAASAMSGVVIVDANTDLVDQSSATAIWRAGMTATTDVAHPGPLAGYYWGRAFAAAIATYWAPVDLLPSSNADLYDATYAPRGCLNANPMMLGTGGTLSGSTPTPTGTVADSWVLSGSDAGLTLAGSKVSSGNVSLQRITLGGTSATSSTLVGISQTISQSGRVVAGDVLEAVAYVSQASASQLFGLSLSLQETYNPGSGSVTVVTSAGDTSHVAAAFMPTDAWSGVLRTPPLTVPAGTLTNLSVRLRLHGVNGSAVSAVVDGAQICVRKVVAGQ